MFFVYKLKANSQNC